MAAVNNRKRTILLASLVLVLSIAHYCVSSLSKDYFQYLYHAFVFLPLILAGFWFGLKGAVATSVAVTLVNFPSLLKHSDKFTPMEFYDLLQLGIYNVVAVSLGILRDRERKVAKRLLEDESLAAMGRALSGVAHEMKTPLIAIGGFSQMLLRNMPEGDPGRDKLGIIVKETRRLEIMVKEMLDFSRPLELHESEEDVFRLIEECLEVVHDMARQRQVMVRCVPAALPHIRVDPMRMKQVFINLVINAIEASPAGETVTVSGVSEGNRIIVDVRDRGDGIPSGKKEAIFSPFFTTKKEGTGLGLPIVKKIVDAHLGCLKILRAPRQGDCLQS